MLVLLVELTQADGHLSGTRARCGHNHEGTRRLDVLVLAEAVVTDDERHVARIARDRVMTVDLDAEGLELLLISDCALLPVEAGEHDGAHIETVATEGIDETQHVHIVGDAEIPADLVLLDVAGIDDDHDLRVILQLTQHADLTIRLKARKHTGCMVIIEQLAAELEIELAAKLRNTLTDMLRLHLEVLIIIETLFKHRTTPSYSLLLRCHRAPIHHYYVNKLKQSKRLNQYKKVISSCQFILDTERPGGAICNVYLIAQRSFVECARGLMKHSSLPGRMTSRETSR